MSRLTNKNTIISGARSGYKTLFTNVYNKLCKLEDIEDELGCPLNVVFKALKEGLIIEAYDDELNVSFIDTFEPNELVLDFDAKSIITGEKYIDYVFPLENYQKTWWLKGDRSDTNE